jgi:hypothetical protein
MPNMYSPDDFSSCTCQDLAVPAHVIGFLRFCYGYGFSTYKLYGVYWVFQFFSHCFHYFRVFTVLLRVRVFNISIIRFLLGFYSYFHVCFIILWFLRFCYGYGFSTYQLYGFYWVFIGFLQFFSLFYHFPSYFKDKSIKT